MSPGGAAQVRKPNKEPNKVLAPRFLLDPGDLSGRPLPLRSLPLSSPSSPTTSYTLTTSTMQAVHPLPPPMLPTYARQPISSAGRNPTVTAMPTPPMATRKRKRAQQYAVSYSEVKEVDHDGRTREVIVIDDDDERTPLDKTIDKIGMGTFPLLPLTLRQLNSGLSDLQAHTNGCYCRYVALVSLPTHLSVLDYRAYTCLLHRLDGRQCGLKIDTVVEPAFHRF